MDDLGSARKEAENNTYVLPKDGWENGRCCKKGLVEIDR